MQTPVLVTGALGHVGRFVVDELTRTGAAVRRAERHVPSPSPGRDTGPGAAGTGAGRVGVEERGDAGDAGAGAVQDVAFDFADPSTWSAAFTGVRTMFLLRPPAVSNVRRDLLPAVAAGRDLGLRHVVFLSLQGADRIPVVPHHAVETWLRSSGLGWTFVRPSFFMQNLSGTHADDVRRGALVVPAGRGRTAFVDTLDVAQVAARALLEPDRYAGRALEPTGDAALTYDEVAAVLSDVLARTVRYDRPGLVRYARHARSALAMPWGEVVVTGAIYTTARLGLAAQLTGDVQDVLHRAPTSLRDFALRERHTWRAPPTE
ncbi:MAG: NmrA family NAD(P)-binding protein [Phycicoccus sp.]